MQKKKKTQNTLLPKGGKIKSTEIKTRNLLPLGVLYKQFSPMLTTVIIKRLFSKMWNYWVVSVSFPLDRYIFLMVFTAMASRYPKKRAIWQSLANETIPVLTWSPFCQLRQECQSLELSKLSHFTNADFTLTLIKKGQ